MEWIKELTDPNYVRQVNFPLSEKDKKYIQTLSPQKKYILKERELQKTQRSLQEAKQHEPRQIKVIKSPEEIERLKEKVRDTKAYEQMTKLIQAKKTPVLPEIQESDLSELFNLINSYQSGSGKYKKRRSTKRPSTKRPSTKRRSTKRRSTKRRSTKRPSTKRRSTKRRSTKRRSTKRRSTKRRSTKRR
jgi:hypothetical protein